MFYCSASMPSNTVFEENPNQSYDLNRALRLPHAKQYETQLRQCRAGNFLPRTIIHDPVIILACLNQLRILFFIDLFINTCEVLNLPSDKFEKASNGVKVLKDSDEKIVKIEIGMAA